MSRIFLFVFREVCVSCHHCHGAKGTHGFSRFAIEWEEVGRQPLGTLICQTKEKVLLQRLKPLPVTSSRYDGQAEESLKRAQPLRVNCANRSARCSTGPKAFRL